MSCLTKLMQCVFLGRPTSAAIEAQMGINMSESEDGTAAETYRYTNTKFARYMEKTGSSLAVVSAKKKDLI